MHPGMILTATHDFVTNMEGSHRHFFQAWLERCVSILYYTFLI
uniref:Uncharacterized protein n=1 Tax=Arundo donax TaxID=35708 RepID=A0A0A9ABH2_ARUDO